MVKKKRTKKNYKKKLNFTEEIFKAKNDYSLRMTSKLNELSKHIGQYQTSFHIIKK